MKRFYLKIFPKFILSYRDHMKFENILDYSHSTNGMRFISSREWADYNCVSSNFVKEQFRVRVNFDSCTKQNQRLIVCWIYSSSILKNVPWKVMFLIIFKQFYCCKTSIIITARNVWLFFFATTLPQPDDHLSILLVYSKQFWSNSIPMAFVSKKNWLIKSSTTNYIIRIVAQEN